MSVNGTNPVRSFALSPRFLRLAQRHHKLSKWNALPWRALPCLALPWSCLALPWSSLHCLGLPHNAWYCLLLPCMFHRAPFPLSQHPPPPSACFFTQTQFVSQDFLTDFSQAFAFTLLPLCNIFFSNILDQSIKLPPSWRFEAQSSFWKPVLPRVRFLAATFSGTTDTYLLTASFFWPPELKELWPGKI